MGSPNLSDETEYTSQRVPPPVATAVQPYTAHGYRRGDFFFTR